jgi:hypothetical protein
MSMPGNQKLAGGPCLNVSAFAKTSVLARCLLRWYSARASFVAPIDQEN